MAGVSIKKIRLYYRIREFYNSSRKTTHFHVDELTMRGVPRRYWYKLVTEAFDLSKAYIGKKKYAMDVYIAMYVKIKRDSKNNKITLKDIKTTYEPFQITFYRSDLNLFKDVFFQNVVYSEELSDLYGRPVYKYHFDDDADDTWCLFLL